MRGWQFGSLGPGIYALPANRFLIPGGEILAELNAELRWTFYQGLQLAPFLDIGNVWFWKTSLFEDNRGILSGRTLRPAIAGGIGLRWDFSFLVIRLDVGQQVYDPATNRWIGPNLPIGGFAAQYHIAIGYPF
jgi:outer membrane protein insertion porin family